MKAAESTAVPIALDQPISVKPWSTCTTRVYLPCFEENPAPPVSDEELPSISCTCSTGFLVVHCLAAWLHIAWCDTLRCAA